MKIKVNPAGSKIAKQADKGMITMRSRPSVVSQTFIDIQARKHKAARTK